MFWETLLFTAGVTLPVCVMLLSGIALKHWQFIDDAFIQAASRLVFHFCLPSLLFLSLAHLDWELFVDPNLVVFGVVSSVLAFLGAGLLSLKTVPVASDRGVFIQGAARGNLAIVGLALAGNLYGSDGIALMSLLMGFLIPVYNIASVWVLRTYSGDVTGEKQKGTSLFLDLLKNPLIIAVLLGGLVCLSGWPLPGIVDEVGGYFARVALPLALICIGGSLSLKSLTETSGASLWASLHKVALMPMVLVPVAWLAGFRNMELGILFLAYGCPTAAASFVMAKAARGNTSLAANIVVLTTLGALLATSAGIFILRGGGII